MISYAQNYEDVILDRALGNVHDGFYVDVGAASPVDATVTRHFYELGWHGVNIEPLPHWATQLKTVRLRDLNLEVAAGASSGEMTLYRVLDDLSLSTLSEEIAERYRQKGMDVEPVTVKVVTLDEVLDEVRPVRIDFLKIDVEGAEPDVIRGIDLRRWRPRVVLVEATEPYSFVPTEQYFEPMLLASGYQYASTDGINRYYVADEERSLAPLLVPANSLDDFVPMREQLLIDEIARLRRFVSNLQRSGGEAAAGDVEGAEGTGPGSADRARGQARRTADAEYGEPRRAPTRFAFVASPQCGAARLAVTVAGALNAPEAAVEHPADVAWDDLPDAGVLRFIWPRTARLSALLAQHGFQTIAVARHPFDLLLAICRLAQVDRTTLEWLAGDLGSEDDLLGADPTSQAFVNWATSARAVALVGVSQSWWSAPDVVRFRYEELLADPAGELSRAVALATGAPHQVPADLLPARDGRMDLEQIPGNWPRYLTAEVAKVLASVYGDVLAVLGYEADLSAESLADAAGARRAWAALNGDAK